jgi:hypothetical protein
VLTSLEGGGDKPGFIVQPITYWGSDLPGFLVNMFRDTSASPLVQVTDGMI